MNGEPSHEVYAYLDNTGEAVVMTDPEPVKKHDNELHDVYGQLVGILEKVDANGAEKWVMPNHDTTLLLRTIQQDAPNHGVQEEG